MRIASLVPSATEALHALGFGDSVVAVTHECDWPAAARELPHLTTSVIEPGLEPAEVDRRVRDLTARGEAIYGLDEKLLAALEPDLIVTQAVCAVCAVSFDEVCEVAAGLPAGPRVISLDPEGLEDVLTDLPRLAEACGERARGERLEEDLRRRLSAVAESVSGTTMARALALEWLDPPYVGGHWVPEMIAVAGGEDVLGQPRERSRTADWDALRRADADLVLVMPCGLDAAESAAQARDHAADLASLGASRVVALDAAGSFSRPGPRLVDGIELLAHLFHPDRAAPPDGLRWLDVSPAVA